MESPAANREVAPSVTSLQPRSRDIDDNNMAYARRCVVMEIIKAETDYVSHLHDVVQVFVNHWTIFIATERHSFPPSLELRCKRR